MAHPVTAGRPVTGFRHELLEYRGSSHGTRLVGDLAHQAVEAGAPVLVVAPADKLDAVRQQFGRPSDSSPHGQIRFLDLEGPLRNPALLAQILVDFVDAHTDGQEAVGIAEVTYVGRSFDELAECELHDSLLGDLFADARPWHLTCPIDVGALSNSTVKRARRLHGPDAADEAELARTVPLVEPDPAPPVFAFSADSAREARAWTVERGRAEGLAGQALESLEIVAGELTVNSITYGGGAGTIRVWSNANMVVCEVADHGHLDDPLAGRRRPELLQIGGRGLWIVNQFCALVQVRSTPRGSVVRAHLARAAEPQP